MEIWSTFSLLIKPQTFELIRQQRNGEKFGLKSRAGSRLGKPDPEPGAFVILGPVVLTIFLRSSLYVGGTTGSASDQQSTNDRKVAGSRPTEVVCITVLTGNRMGWTAHCGRPPLLPSCWSLGCQRLVDSDLAWVNDKSGRQSWRYADAFQRCIISEAIYHFLRVCLVGARKISFLVEPTSSFIRAASLRVKQWLFIDGQFITRAGDVAQELYYIKYGQVCVHPDTNANWEIAF